MAEKTGKRSPIPAAKTVRMRSGIVRVPKSYIEHLGWNMDAECEIEIKKNMVLIKNQVKRCGYCGKQMSEEDFQTQAATTAPLGKVLCENCRVLLQKNLT